jgi:hypothetical protein
VKTVHHYIWFVFVVLMSPHWSHAQSARSPQPFSLVIQTPEKVYKSGELIPLEVTVKNISQSDIRMLSGPGSTMAEQHFEVIGTDPTGAPLEETPRGLRVHGKDPKHPVGGSKYSEVIAPGGLLHQKLFVNLPYNFTAVGTYSIQIRRVYEGDNRVTVISNAINITIEPQ